MDSVLYIYFIKGLSIAMPKWAAHTKGEEKNGYKQVQQEPETAHLYLGCHLKEIIEIFY